MTQRKQGRCPKSARFGCKQLHGHSRQAYFARAPHRIAANKARRIEKERRRQEQYATSSETEHCPPKAEAAG